MKKSFPESPAFTFNQPEESYNYMERRKSSIHNESDIYGTQKWTEDDDTKQNQKLRSSSIVPFDLDTDKDGFKKPKELKTEEMPGRRNSIDMMNPEMQIISPLFPSRLSPLLQADDRAYRMPFGPVTMSPLLNSNQIAPTYSPNIMRFIPPEYIGTPGEQFMKTNMLRIDEVQSPSQVFSPSSQNNQETQQNVVQISTSFVQSDNFRLDDEVKEIENNKPEQMIGGLTISQRKDKIKRYLEKRKRRIWKKKISYDCRKKVADKRLRIKGRFVTKEQAFSILGMTHEDLASNELLQTLIANNDHCSIMTSAKNMKIRNLQTLLNTTDKPKAKTKKEKVKSIKNKTIESGKRKISDDENHLVRVEILKKSAIEQSVEIKIEAVTKDHTVNIPSRISEKLPKFNNPIFEFVKLNPDQIKPNHSKYHKH